MSYTGPYTNFHEINLNLFIRALKKLKGGIGGQSLVKKSNIEYDYEWKALTAQDVGALPDSYTAPVDSVNGLTGDVKLNSENLLFDNNTIYNALIAALPLISKSGKRLVLKNAAENLFVKNMTIEIPESSDGYNELTLYNDHYYPGFVNWNQISPYNDNEWTNSPTITVSGSFNSELTLTANTNTTAGKLLRPIDSPLTVNHVYLCSCFIKSVNNAEIGIGLRTSSGAQRSLGTLWHAAVDFEYIACIGKPIELTDYYTIGLRNNTVIDAGGIFKNICLFDLTAMFGETVADEVYAMEAANTGAGVEWFRNLFPDDYYDYNTGTETTAGAVNGMTTESYTVDWSNVAGRIYTGGNVDLTNGLIITNNPRIEYNIDPLPLTLFLGNNNLWSSLDSNISIEYYANVKLYIDNLLGGV